MIVKLVLVKMLFLLIVIKVMMMLMMMMMMMMMMNRCVLEASVDKRLVASHIPLFFLHFRQLVMEETDTSVALIPVEYLTMLQSFFAKKSSCCCVMS